MSASQRFEDYMKHLAGGRAWAYGPARGAEGLLHRAFAAPVAQECGADGGTGRSAARERPTVSCVLSSPCMKRFIPTPPIKMPNA